ncbi:endothelin-converting enzyme homolog [Gigantopelta aegis]|uniref:endothelin-converting enzyme homolog n=1 Tax=Gigantopelta aegis TaxID=1735272 RepID=UPI001B88E11A|nr:endothelin-converting enzyme homolog [Gigantopelta aegis]
MAEHYKEFDKNPIMQDVTFRGYSFRRRELALAGVAVLSLFVCVILGALLASTGEQSGPSAKRLSSEYCLDSMCLRSAAYVLENINSSVNPCEDFYQYSCGQWARRNPLPPDLFQLSTTWKMYNKNEERLRKLIESPVRKDSPWSAEKKAKDFFRSCMDDYGKMRAQANPFLTQVLPNIGGAYVLGTVDFSTYDFQESLRKTHVDYWTNAFFTYYVRTDWYDWRKRGIQLDLSGMGMSYVYYMRNDTVHERNSYKKFIKKVAGFLIRDSGLNVTNQSERIQTFLEDVFYVEQELANITSVSDQTENPHEYEKQVTLQDLTSRHNNAIDWSKFFSYMFSDAGVSPQTKVVLLEAQYLQRMADLINRLPAQNKSRILNNYLTWRLTHKYVQDLSWDYIHANREFYVDLTGQAEFLGTWRYCYSIVDRDMSDAMSSLYVRDHFIDENKQKAHEIVDYLKSSIVERISKDVWLEKPTRDIAIRKLKESVYKLGYPDYMMDDSKLDEMYQTLKIKRDDYFSNLLNLNKYYKFDWNRRLRLGVDKSEWVYRTYAVVAEFYNPWAELIVPAGLLQWPIYDHKLPHFMNFGSVGSILGHHLVHAIDEHGSLYKLDGSWWGDWWTNKTKSNYNKIRQCVIRAYTNRTQGPFRLPNGRHVQVRVQPRRYAPEALAETSGIEIAFKAYQEWTKQNAPEKRTPGLSLTNEQMFFVAYAQANCFNRNNKDAFKQAVRGIVQENVKVNMALRQSAEFQRVFNCPASSNMVSSIKCDMY